MRSLSRRRRREPKPHERVWGDRCVDRNLKDEWLISLNKLQAFDLVSTCEGHVSSRHPCPHLNLRLKEEYFPIVSHEWHRSGRTMSRIIDSIFSAEASHVEIELKDVFRKRNGRYTYRQHFGVRIQCLHTRESESIENRIMAWFELIISEIQKLDTFISDLCKEVKQSPPHGGRPIE